MELVTIFWLVVGLLFTHFVSDFVLQTDREALGKSRQLEPLVSHVAKYALGLLVYVYFASLTVPTVFWVLWLVVNVLLHFAVDFVTSKVNSKLHQKESKHDFFVAVGFDQFLHNFILIGSLFLVLILVG